MPKARIILVSDAGLKREVASDSTGRYVLPLLPPGHYRLDVAAQGFAGLKVSDVVVKITETSIVDLPLKVAAATSEVVQVSAAPPLVNSENATTGRVIEQETIRQLPLPTRNFTQLLTLTTGTSGSIQNSSELGRGDAVVSVNGARTTSNAVVINGMDSSSIGTGATPNLAVPATDTLQEFIVQTSLYDATQGRNTGGVVAAVTKSGTDRFHGNVYEFLRDDALNANNFFLKRQGTARPVYRRNQFGGTLGGPIVKQRLWFFTSYQGTRETNGTSLLNSLSAVLVPGNLTNDRSVAALGQISLIPGYVNPIALKIFQAKLPNGQYLIPSSPVNTGTKTPVPVTVPTTSKFQEDQFNANLDFKLSDANRLSARFFWANNPTKQGLYSFAGVQNPLQAPGAATGLDLHNRVLSINDTHVISPTMINDFRAGGSVITAAGTPDEPFKASDWGISSPLSSLFAGAPTIEVSNAIDLNASPLADQFSQTKTYTFNDTLTWTKGRHQMKFGGEYKRQEINLKFNAYTRGELFFFDYPTMLAGLPLLSIMGSGDPARENRARDWSVFFQDDFHVNSRLTLNAGVRYDRYGPFTEEKGRFVAFDPALATYTAGVLTAGFVQAGNGTLPNIPKVQDGLVPADNNNIAPRVGFAYKLFKNDDSIVLRGGYGIYYDRMNARLFNSQVFNTPYDMIAVSPVTNFTTRLINIADPFVHVPLPSAFPLAFNSLPFTTFQQPIIGQPNGIVPGSGIFPDRHNFHTPYTQQYNLGVQMEPLKNWLVDIGYVGSVGRKLTHLLSLNSINAPIAQQPYLGAMSNYVSPVLGTYVEQTTGKSSYNSLQASVTKRYSFGLQFLASYTWSHSIDDYSGGDVNDLIGLAGDTRLHYVASSDFDRRHRFVFSYVYDLPRFYKGGNAAAKRVVNNWQVAGITTFQTGTPFSIIGSQSAFSSVFGQLANGRTPASAVKSGSIPNRIDQYFDTTAFTTVPAGTFGQPLRNVYRGPGQSNFDFSVVKFIPITESQKFEFRTEFFNLFNHTNFANPVGTYGPAFGKVLRTSSGPRVVQFAFKYSF